MNNLQGTKLSRFSLSILLLAIAMVSTLALQIESNFRLGEALVVASVFSSISYWLTDKWKPLVFLLATAVVSFVILGLPNGFILLMVMSLFSFIIYGAKTNELRSIVMFGILLLLVLLQWAKLPFVDGVLLTVVCSAFTFRSIAFWHDAKTLKTQPSFLNVFSYFYMLPNIFFVLFPVIDYKTFIKSGQQDENHFQKTFLEGSKLIIRGIFQILLYRIIYYLVYPRFFDAATLFEFMVLAASSFLMVIRIIGIYHIAIGILKLFGFNMPPIFNNPFFASGFSDLWRRTNIYWRDFVIKVFYYPILFKFGKKKNLPWVVFLVIFLCFIITWFLHSWQWFMLKGSFPIRLTDAVFWLSFGLVVAANAFIQQRKLEHGQKPISPSLIVNSINSLFVFGFMSFLWVLWNAPSLEAFKVKVISALHFTPITLVGVAMLIVVYMSAATCYTLQLKITKPWYNHLLLIFQILVIAAFMSILYRDVPKQIKLKTGINIRMLVSNKPNKIDKKIMEEAYYDNMLSVNNLTSPFLKLFSSKPDDWETFLDSDICEPTGNISQKKIKPNIHTIFKESNFTSNSFGFRDKEYSIQKPSNTIRIALIGGSIEMGSGVSDEEVFSEIVEKRLHDTFIITDSSRSVVNMEILNFSVSGYQLPQQAYAIENSIHKFHPDYILLVAHTEQKDRMVANIARSIRSSQDLYYPFLKSIALKSGLNSNSDNITLTNELMKHQEEISDSLYAIIQQSANQINARVIWVYIPALYDNYSTSVFEKEAGKAQSFDFIVWNMGKSFEKTERKELSVNEWDTHPNAKGHRLLAKEFLKNILEHQNDLNLSIKRKTDGE